jgi:hypothetical protein
LLFLKTRLPLHRFREKDELVKANFEKDCGEVAQSVEQRTENPCVGGSIPSFTTPLFSKQVPDLFGHFFF